MTEMITKQGKKPVEEYLAREYSFNVLADPEGGYVVEFPDLPGCMTQVESLEEVSQAVEEIRTLWIETAYEQGQEIPPPTYPEEYSGKFNVRLPKSLHRSLAEGAKREGVSLNQYVATLLARGDVQARVESVIGELQAQLGVETPAGAHHEKGETALARAVREQVQEALRRPAGRASPRTRKSGHVRATTSRPITGSALGGTCGARRPGCRTRRRQSWR